MKVLYVGYTISKELCNTQEGASVAGNNMQIGIVKGLINKLGDNLKCITINPISAYPRNKVKWVKEEQIKIEEDIYAKQIKFLNIKIIKDVSILFSLLKEMIKFIIENKNDKEKTIITYNGNFHIAIPALVISRLLKVKYICMVVDPPLYQGTIDKSTILIKMQQNINRCVYELAMKKSHKLIILNEYVIKYFNLNKEYLVIDGGVSILEQNQNEIEYSFDKSYFNIVFTGSLTEHSGIMRAINSFQKINDDNIRLYIYGKGPYQATIEEKCKLIKNIEFKGFVPNDVARTIQKKADLILCPNYVDHPINKVAFPSKIIECMVSGTPVICTRVNGLSKDYLNYVFTYLDDDDSLEREIIKIAEMPSKEIRNKGRMGQEFIEKNKTWDRQAEKVYRFLIGDNNCECK